MSNLQVYIAVGLPIIAVITSLVISLAQISAIREDMRAQVGAIREDIREIRSDIKLLTGKVYELMGHK
jgi:hypothetical protein